MKVEEGSTTLDKYIQENHEKDGLAMSPGSAINQMSVNGLEKKFLDEVDGYAQGKHILFMLVTMSPLYPSDNSSLVTVCDEIN